MKIRRKCSPGGRLAVLLLLLTALLGCATASAASDASQLTILFTHDTHDHFYPDGADRGGYVRLASLLQEERARAEGAVVTVDAGDFSMGSLFQTIYTTNAPELRAMGAMGYDVVTLGNHEFDYRGQGLAEMLSAAKAAKAAGEWLPAIVQANYREAKDPATGGVAAEAMNDYPVSDYVILESNGQRIAVFGLMGLDADECAPMSGMFFEPVAQAAERVVRDIQDHGGADFVIALSHTGTEEGKGEDYELVKAVDGIDVIVSGHTHTTIPEPIRVNDTLIVSAGENAQNLGRLTIEKKKDEVRLVDYALLPVDDSIPDDPALAAMAADFQWEVEETFLGGYGLGYHQELAEFPRDFTIQETGDLIGDAYIAAVKAMEGENYVPVDFAVAPNGVIRDNFKAGAITTASAFDVLSLGSGADGTPTYPLLSVYLTGEDLINAFEIDASISMLMSAATLYGAGMHWTYNSNRMILDKITDAAQILPDGSAVPIEPDRLYRVVADLYTGQMLGAVEAQSFGILSVTPRDEQGEPVTDLESRILHREDGRELKAWYALAAYLDGQETVAVPESSKTVTSSWNPVTLLAAPGAPTLIVLAVILLLLTLVVLVVLAVIRRNRRKKR